jgi:hypothetical protein
MIDETDLPDELQSGEGAAARMAPKELSAEERAALDDRLNKLGELVGGKRDAAVRARKESGIEDIWKACEEAYAGIDELNRGTAAGSQPWRKAMTTSGPLTRETPKAPENRSTVFVRLTTRYVDMASSKAKEKALPIGGMPFSMKPSPAPELVTAAGETEVQAQPAPNPATAQPAQMTAAAQAAKEAIAKASESAKKASKRIWDWMEEARFGKKVKRIIDDSARIGVGVLKGPFPEGTTDRALSVEGGLATLEVIQRTYPGVKWVSPWNFFPAGNCGEDIHDGDYVFERSFLSESKLRALKNLREPMGLPIYLGTAIDEVIEQGPDKCNVDENGNRRQVQPDKKGLYQVWEYTGEMTRQDMIALEALGAEDLPDDIVYCNAIVTLVNDTVIRAQFNPLQKSGNFPYRVFPWSRRAGYWAGVGVGEQVDVPQKMINGATRAWMNNAGVSSGVQLLKDPRIVAADGSSVIGGGIKIWEPTADALGIDVRQLMQVFEIPNLGPELKAIVDYAFQLAEELSNIPLVTQGRDGATTPQTFGQAELQNTNGNTLLRSVAESLDDDVFEPLINDYYEILLLDPEVPEDEKGDFQIIAKGCQAMVEKAIQEQTLLMMGQLTLNPAFGMNPAKWARLFFETKRIDPEELEYTEQEKQDLQKNQQKPVQVQVAEVNASARLHEADMRGTVQREIASNQHDRGVAYESALADQDRIRLELGREELALKRELAMLDYASRHNLTLEQVKGQLAQTAMKINAQRDISRDNLAVALHTHHNPAPGPDALTPPVEPAGRAAPGQSFSQ